MNNNSIITCGKGWEKLYERVIDRIIEFDSKQDSVEDKIGIGKIKEENGVLSFELIQPENITYEINDLIDDVKHGSLYVCEFCGAVNDVGVTLNNSYKTCCKYCWEHFILSKTPTSIWKNKTNGKIYKIS